MANMWDPSVNPDVTTTQTTTTTAPDYYNDHLQYLATQGQAAIGQGGVADFSNLQNAAFRGAGAAVDSGQPYLDAAADYVSQAGDMSAADAGQQYFDDASDGSALDAAGRYFNRADNNAYQGIDRYMNPYIDHVVDRIGELGQEQWEDTIAPGMTAGAVGSGQFGSKRGMEIYGNAAARHNRDVLGQQYGALKSGYDTALTASQTDLRRQLELGIAAGNLSDQDLDRMVQMGIASGQLTDADADRLLTGAKTSSDIGAETYRQETGGIKLLSDLGAIQQANEQAKLDYPMNALEDYSKLLRGYNVPMNTTNTYTGPMNSSYYGNSPLSTIAGIVTGVGGILTNPEMRRDLISTLKGLYGWSGEQARSVLTEMNGGEWPRVDESYNPDIDPNDGGTDVDLGGGDGDDYVPPFDDTDY